MAATAVESMVIIMERNQWIYKKEVIGVIANALRTLDERLIEHGERVAYLAWKLYSRYAPADDMDMSREELLMVSFFHDIGAYKTEEIDNMIQFESSKIWSHSIYGYLFLKHMSPMKECGEAILYHHLNYNQYQSIHSKYLKYAAYITLADRIDILLKTYGQAYDFRNLRLWSGVKFKPELVESFLAIEKEEQVISKLQDLSYKKEINEAAEKLDMRDEEAMDYLKMLIYSIDFRSEHTVTHTINTTAISVELARRCGLCEEECQMVYLGALLHDVGKIAIPENILEYPGKLDDNKMEIMKTHVVYTEKIIGRVVNEEIVQIAIRHHEKLDGSGYPGHRTGKELTKPQRIVAISDIISALADRRSYKEPFPKEKTLEILGEMAKKHQLDEQICQLVQEEYDSIIEATKESRQQIIDKYVQIKQEYEMYMNALEKYSEI